MTTPIFTPEEDAVYAAQAQQRGYADLRAYLRALVAQDSDQAYFYSAEWQAQEQQADADIQAGRVATFDTMEAMLADLQNDDE